MLANVNVQVRTDCANAIARVIAEVADKPQQRRTPTRRGRRTHHASSDIASGKLGIDGAKGRFELDIPTIFPESVRLNITKTTCTILAWTVLAFAGSASGALPEYSAAEAPKHVGETATVVGKVSCIGAGRTFHDLQLDGCSPNSPFWIIVNNDATGPELDLQELQDVTIAVTGTIEKRDVYSHPWMVVKTTSQIVARTPKQTDYIGHAYDKEQKGDIDGAIADLNQAVEHQPTRRDEACQHLAVLKDKKGDWTGALAVYDQCISFKPNDGGPYYSRAVAKKQHGDFDGAMADFSHAAELRASGVSLIDIGNMRKANGDSAGALAEYDKAIAMLDRQISGAQKPSGRMDLLYYHRGWAKELKGDVDGAVADYTQAIAIKPTYGAGAYSKRGDIKKARGDVAGAVADYQHAVQYAQLEEDKAKLRNARAELKSGGGKAARLNANSNEESSGSPASAPNGKSIAQQFVEAYSGNDVDALAGLYADRVDHTNSGVISNDAVRAQAQEYFARWPVRHWSLVGTVSTVSLGTSKKKVIFSATYDASDPGTNKHASGIAKETLILATDPSGAMKIVSQREQISKGNTTQAGEKASENPGLKAAKAEYDASSHDEVARVRYATKLADLADQLTPLILHNPDVAAKEAAAGKAGAINEELRKLPMSPKVDSNKLRQSLIGKWESPRHVYVFRTDGTYGVADGDRTKWRIDGNEFIDDFSRGPIILLDDNYFIYGCGGTVTFYTRHKDLIKSNKPSDVALRERIVGYWKNPKVAFHMAADGKMYDCPQKAGGDIFEWDVRDGKFYWSGEEYEIVTLTNKEFVYRELDGQKTTFIWTKSTKEEVDPE